jgi:hypothetical protein
MQRKAMEQDQSRSTLELAARIDGLSQRQDAAAQASERIEAKASASLAEHAAALDEARQAVKRDLAQSAAETSEILSRLTTDLVQTQGSVSSAEQRVMQAIDSERARVEQSTAEWIGSLSGVEGRLKDALESRTARADEALTALSVSTQQSSVSLEAVQREIAAHGAELADLKSAAEAAEHNVQVFIAIPRCVHMTGLCGCVDNTARSAMDDSAPAVGGAAAAESGLCRGAGCAERKERWLGADVARTCQCGDSKGKALLHSPFSAL